MNGCVDIIEFETISEDSYVVIFGKLTNGKGPHYINIARTGGSEEGSNIPETGARIQLIDGTGNSVGFTENGNGQYELFSEDFEGKPGEFYSIEILLRDGNRYISSEQQMPAVIGKDKISYRSEKIDVFGSQGVLVERNVVRIYSTIDLPVIDEAYFLKWDVSEMHIFPESDLPLNHFPFWSPKTCYIENPIGQQSIKLFEGDGKAIATISDQLLASRDVDLTFYNPHYFTVVQSSITRDAYQYWQKVDEIANRSGSIFDSQPANVPGNIVNPDNPGEIVLGFFEVALTDTSRIFTTRADFEFLIPPSCETDVNVYRVPYGCVPCLADQRILEEECINCLLIPNSTLIRPSYLD